MAKSRIMFSGGSLALRYPGQFKYQPVIMDIYPNGTVDVKANPEIGNAVPANVFHSLVIRVSLPGVSIQTEARDFYAEHIKLIHRISAGMGEKWDGNNTVGTLTDDAREALEELRYLAANG